MPADGPITRGPVERAPGTRGRVVMLVYNGVEGDSRVQKVARSAADAGWEVFLLGRTLGKQERTWMEGGAEVRLIQASSPMGRRKHEYRRRWLRGPLGYPPTGIAAYRHHQIKAWRSDLWTRQCEIMAQNRAEGPTTGRKVKRIVLRAQQGAARIAAGWVGLRFRQLNQAAKARRRLTGPWDRLQAFLWVKLMGNRAWRRLEPRLWDYDLAFGPMIDELEPDLIHAHDFRMIGVGARAATRAQGQGRDTKLVWDVHEYTPGVSPGNNTVRWLPGHILSEKEYAGYADAVVTVSDTLSGMLVEDHKLKKRPYVMLNAPNVKDLPVDAAAATAEPGIREVCGLGPDVPLLVYSGGAVVHRGLGEMVEGLPELPGVHVAFVVPSVTDTYVLGLRARAEELGVSDRVHIMPFVPYWRVVSFLASATAGVIPIHHWPNHEIALITKFFEYSHARLPIIVSDVQTMSEKVRETGQGEVFRAEDVADYVRAARAVLADVPRYRAVYDGPGLLDQWTWERQAEVLDEIYTDLHPGGK